MALIGGSRALAKDILKADRDTHDPDPESGTPGHGSAAGGKNSPRRQARRRRIHRRRPAEMGAIRLAIVGMLALGFLCLPSGAAAQPKTECSLEDDAVSDYDHARFAPDADIRRRFEGFEVSFDSDDDDGRLGTNLLRVPHWVAQEIRRWQPPANEIDFSNDDAWCLNTGERPDWFTDDDLFEAGAAPDNDSYRNSGYDRGQMAEEASRRAARTARGLLHAYGAERDPTAQQVQPAGLAGPGESNRGLGPDLRQDLGHPGAGVLSEHGDHFLDRR